MSPTLTHLPKHLRDARICSPLIEDLRKEYHRRNTRVIKGDTVKVMRGEYTGIEGKVEKVNTERGTLAIEGVQREKIRGGNVKVQIHASNVTILSLNLQDKYRQTKLQNLKHDAKGDNRDTKLKRRKSAVTKRAEKKEEDKI
ncbi:MAG TPA: 50S ribosomal protein L24 [Nitrososphaeraceae archaeon]|nr:50S ribosomal protein L24 [Nitrososphaeraceae archaeon]